MRSPVFPSILEAELNPDLVQLGPNLIAVNFFLNKIIPACHVLERARAAGLLAPGGLVVESTSGSFGLALAMVARLRGYRLTMVSDPVVDDRLRRRLEELGARVELVTQPAARGGLQEARLQRVRAILHESPGAYWPQQYDNPWNLDAYTAIAQALADTLGPIDCLVGTVGSGGSVCGMGRELRRRNSRLRLVGVDTLGSVLFGQPDGVRLLRGLGNSIMPRILDHAAFQEVHWVSAGEGFRMTRELHASTALFRGPTSGAAYLVARWWAQRHPDARVVVLLPDEGHRYDLTVYNDDWLRDHGVLQSSLPDEPRLVAHPEEARSSWSYLRWNGRTLKQVLDGDGSA